MRITILGTLCWTNTRPIPSSCVKCAVGKPCMRARRSESCCEHPDPIRYRSNMNNTILGSILLRVLRDVALESRAYVSQTSGDVDAAVSSDCQIPSRMTVSSRIFLLKHSAWRQDLIIIARASQYFLEEPRYWQYSVLLEKDLIGDLVISLQLGRKLPSACHS